MWRALWLGLVVAASRRALPAIEGQKAGSCSCGSAPSLGIWSDRQRITPQTRAKLP
jgi:hypothetical protein